MCLICKKSKIILSGGNDQGYPATHEELILYGDSHKTEPLFYICGEDYDTVVEIKHDGVIFVDKR